LLVFCIADGVRRICELGSNVAFGLPLVISADGTAPLPPTFHFLFRGGSGAEAM
jgi:hypothetical protein